MNQVSASEIMQEMPRFVKYCIDHGVDFEVGVESRDGRVTSLHISRGRLHGSCLDREVTPE